DETGVAAALSEAIGAHGGRTVLIRTSEGGGGEAEAYTGAEAPATVNLTDRAGVDELVREVRQRHGPIAGIVHLLPLKPAPSFETMEASSLRHRLDLELKGLFHLVQAAASDLSPEANEGGSWIVAATSLGGGFGGDPPGGSFFPGHGGVSGLVKTLALEWPGARCKVVDLDPGAETSERARQLFTELAAGDDEVEVGYRGGSRLVRRPRPAPLATDEEAGEEVTIDEGSVIVLTGGARGITAEVARELAERYRPTLVLVGRSPVPPAEESPETGGRTSPRELKAALIEQLRSQDQPVTAERVEAAHSRILREREIRSTLAAIERAGATVDYRQVDVRDERAVAALIDDLYRSYGRLDGVIHGAGVIEDRLIEDKSADSFDRVLDTKAVSAFALCRALQPDSLRFLVFFSSVAGLFGNRGQCDYAAANEILNKLALYLDARWAARVVSINWAPWAGAGMVSPELVREFARRDVPVVAPPAGRQAFHRELRSGRKGHVEVLLGVGDGVIGRPAREEPPGVAARVHVTGGEGPGPPALDAPPRARGRAS
ncbi:MAG TPA: SDR family NAD(P)-dependent oxidoreductase, partial [Thermoleophilaceae bacterium]|nr:SDR family NAD(P)-dependent oxidoreductase [Thermoleophilaceae bacterium]